MGCTTDRSAVARDDLTGLRGEGRVGQAWNGMVVQGRVGQVWDGMVVQGRDVQSWLGAVKDFRPNFNSDFSPDFNLGRFIVLRHAFA